MELLFLILIAAIILFVILLAIVFVVFLLKKKTPKQIAGNGGTIPPAAAQSVKRCPKCQSTYTDQSLNFCLTDGTPLLLSGGDNEFETVVRNR
jgi:hypothetical protein